MTYRVKSIFGPTLQGEGLHAGMPCVFVRLSGCNAWDGRSETRAASACPYCDTDFRGGDTLDAVAIVDRLRRLVPRASGHENSTRFVSYGCVLTGGEPLLQADITLLRSLTSAFAWVDVETNGTRQCPYRADNLFISCSPKVIADQPILVDPDWWKILIPDQESFLEAALMSGKTVFLQPTAPEEGPVGATYRANLERCVQLCLTRGCRLSLQLHKYLGID